LTQIRQVCRTAPRLGLAFYLRRLPVPTLAFEPSKMGALSCSPCSLVIETLEPLWRTELDAAPKPGQGRRIRPSSCSKHIQSITCCEGVRSMTVSISFATWTALAHRRRIALYTALQSQRNLDDRLIVRMYPVWLSYPPHSHSWAIGKLTLPSPATFPIDPSAPCRYIVQTVVQQPN
jgi:hypothetical protein